MYVPLVRLSRKYPSREAEVNAERVHFEIVRSLAADEFSALHYLYDRLCIVDAKATGMLTFNDLIFTALSIVGTRTENPLNLKELLIGNWHAWALLLGTLALLGSSVLCLRILYLQFDHLTRLDGLPTEAKAKIAAAYGHGANGATVTNANLAQLAGVAPAPLLAPRTLAEYKASFFLVTVKRQVWLRWAKVLAAAAVLPIIAVIWI